MLPFGLWTKLRFSLDVFTQTAPRRHEYNLAKSSLATLGDGLSQGVSRGLTTLKQFAARAANGH